MLQFTHYWFDSNSNATNCLITILSKLIDSSNSLNPPSEYTIIKMSVDWEELNAKLPYQKNEVKKKDKMKSVKILFLKNLKNNEK